MSDDIVIYSNPDTSLSPVESIGRIANEVAGRHTFDAYLARKAANTINRQARDLELFAQYLAVVGMMIDGYSLQHNPELWRGMTWGLVVGFVEWQLRQGYAVSSVNIRLSTVKAYAALAHQAGVIGAEEAMLIKGVSGYSRQEGKRLDEKRPVVRVGKKKVEAVSLTAEQARQLKQQPDTPQGRRDAVMMSLLLDHGLRVGELVGLQVTNFDLKAGTMTFYREKVDKVQKHKLTADALRATRAYFDQDALPMGPLLRGSHRSGRLMQGGMNRIAITVRVRLLGETIGIKGLSAHDCRHYWATAALASGTQIDRLQDAGGWASPAMPLRYAEAARIANQGVKLPD